MCAKAFLQDVRPGQAVELTAADVNAWNSAARATIGGSTTVSETRRELFAGWLPNVKIKNDSGEDVPRYGVLTLGGVLFTVDDNEAEFLEQPVFHGAMPTDNPDNIPVICFEPIAAGKIGMGFAPGLAVPVVIDVEDEDHEYADLKEDSVEVLASFEDHGYPILWKESGTGEKWAKILLVRKPKEYPMIYGPLVDDPDEGWTVDGKPVSVPASATYTDTWVVEGFIVKAFWDGTQYAAVPPQVITATLQETLDLDGVATCHTCRIFAPGVVGEGDDDVDLEVFDFLLWGPLPAGTRITCQLDSQGMRYVVNGASCPSGA